ncbi:metallophosphoesterase [Delftia tsuruhatensis]
MAPRPMPPAAARAACASPRGPCRCCRTIAPLMKGHAPLPSPVSPDALAGSLGMFLAGEPVHLLAQHALWWPAQGTLFIADLHLGKAATFRARGIPVPAGTTQGNLERLSALLLGLPVRRLVVLGDFLHAAEARNPAVLAALARWRSRHAAVELVLVRGNHDSHAGDPPPALGFAIVDEPWHLGPFAACHHPRRQRRTCRRSRPGPGMCWPAMSIPPSCCAAPAATPCVCRALPCTLALPCCPPSACSPAWPACRPSQAASSLPWARTGSGPCLGEPRDVIGRNSPQGRCSLQ